MKIKATYFVLILLLASVTYVVSRDFRVNQIPNGSKFSCGSCHVSESGGGARTGFGNAINSSFLSGGNVNWGSALAALDSDGDGYSNGVELQDPNGAWRAGQTAPGNLSLVTNPGDPASFPDPVFVENTGEVPNGFKLYDNFPNPFNPSTTIIFDLPSESVAALKIYDLTGRLVQELVNENLPAGQYKFIWNGRNHNGAALSSGVYFYVLQAGNFYQAKRMLLVK